MKTNAVSRDSNIELLRIVCALGVVMLHINNNLIGKGFEFTENIWPNHSILMLLECIAICAVDTFVIISGYYSVKKKTVKLYKIIILLVQTCFLQLSTYGMRVLGGEIPTVKGILNCFLVTNWYVCIYIALSIISPYINLIFSEMSIESSKKFLILIIFSFSIIPFLTDVYETVQHCNYLGFSPISMDGNGRGYTLVNFVLCYSAGAMISKMQDDSRKVGALKGIMLPFLVFCICTLLIYKLSKHNTSLAWEYCNPLVITNAVSLFCIFKNIHFQGSWLINKLAAAVFPCFIIHTTLLRMLNIQYYCLQTPVKMVAYLICVCIGCFIVAVVIHVIIDSCLQPLWKVLKKIPYEIGP